MKMGFTVRLNSLLLRFLLTIELFIAFLIFVEFLFKVLFVFNNFISLPDITTFFVYSRELISLILCPTQKEIALI